MRKLFQVSMIAVSICLYLGIKDEVLAATPVISGVTGTVSTGATLTVSGSNMVNENKTNWDPFFTKNPNASGFEGASPAADGYSHSTGNTYNPVYDTTVKLMGNQSVKYHVQGAANVSAPVVSYLYMLNSLYSTGGQGDLWARWYSRYDLLGGTWPTGYLKEFYDLGGNYLDTVAQMGTGNLCGGVVGTNTPEPDAFTVKIGSNAYCTSVLPSTLVQNNRWYVVEVHWNNTASNPIFDVYVNNTLIFHSASTGDPDHLGYNLMGIVNYGSGDSTLSLDHWWDGFAVSASTTAATRIYPASIIEISNSPTYGQGTKVWQDPVYLSDGSIQVTANLKGLGSGPYYMWVTNNMQQVSAPYLLGGSTANNVPSAPTLQTIQ